MKWHEGNSTNSASRLYSTPTAAPTVGSCCALPTQSVPIPGQHSALGSCTIFFQQTFSSCSSWLLQRKLCTGALHRGVELDIGVTAMWPADRSRAHSFWQFALLRLAALCMMNLLHIVDPCMRSLAFFLHTHIVVVSCNEMQCTDIWGG